jgi:hypothetical protein
MRRRADACLAAYLTEKFLIARLDDDVALPIRKGLTGLATLLFVIGAENIFR